MNVSHTCTHTVCLQRFVVSSVKTLVFIIVAGIGESMSEYRLT